MDSVIAAAKLHPFSGIRNPVMGTKTRYRARMPPRGTKVVSHAAKRVRDAMVTNLERLVAENYPGVAQSAAYKRIEKATGISLSSMQRIMSGDTGPSIDTLADLAHHLGTTVSELLTARKDVLPTARDTDVAAGAQRLQRGR
jgi:transcriptional regulator with XRE-family HTH domain